MSNDEIKQKLIENYREKKNLRNCLGSVEKVVDELIDGLPEFSKEKKDIGKIQSKYYEYCETLADLNTFEIDRMTQEQFNRALESMLKNVWLFFRPHLTEDKSTELLKELRTAAVELAEYASYSEIVGGISINGRQVREWCDKVFELNSSLKDEEDDEL